MAGVGGPSNGRRILGVCPAFYLTVQLAFRPVPGPTGAKCALRIMNKILGEAKFGPIDKSF